MAELKTIFSADTTGVETAVGRTQNSISGLSSKLAGMFSAGMAISYVKSLIEAQSAIKDQAETIGVSTRMLQGMREMGKDVGVSFEKIQTALNKLDTARLDAIKDKGSNAAKAFAALGISAQQLAGMTGEQAINAMAEAFARSGKGAGETGAMIELLGSRSMALLPVFDQLGTEGEKAFQRLEAAGRISTDNVISDMDRLGDKMSAIGSRIGNFVSKGVSLFIRGVEDLAAMLGYMSDLKAESKDGITAVDLVAMDRQREEQQSTAKKATASAAIIESQKSLLAASSAKSVKLRDDSIGQAMKQEAKTDAVTRIGGSAKENADNGMRAIMQAGGGAKEISDSGMLTIATRQLNALEKIATAVTSPNSQPAPDSALKFIEMKW
jgi:hypothetical protein